MGYQTAQPIMAVNHIIVKRVFLRKSQDILGELWQIGVDVVRVEWLFWPRHGVNDARIFSEHIVDMRNTRILAAREDINFDASPPKFTAQLPDIYVHAARFLAAQNCQRACVNTQNCDPRNGTCTGTQEASNCSLTNVV